MTQEDVNAIIKRLDQIILLLSKPVAASAASSEVADDGFDEDIKKDPPKWNGQPMAPCKMSEGTPAWLAAVASFAEWAARKDEKEGAVTDKGQPKAFFSWRRKARALGWAKRVQPKPVATQSFDDSEELPF